MRHDVAYLALGSNEGDRRAMLRAAADLLIRSPGVEVTRSSPIYEMPAAESAAGQREFLNAVLRVETTLPPERLLRRSHEIEHALGRRRTTPGGSRPIDIDLLLYGGLIRAAPDPILPHPRMHRRRFVLRPLFDLDPCIRHPGLDRSVVDLLATLDGADDLTLVAAMDWFVGARHPGQDRRNDGRMASATA